MPTVLAMIATVAIVTEVIKRFLQSEGIGLTLTKMAKFIIACVSSVGVVGYHWVNSGEVFTVGLVVVLVEVLIGSTQGYNILRKAGQPR